MKKLFIIGTYPSNTYSEQILVSCIDAIINKGYDIMLVSHYPLPTYIQEKVNYYIFDKENIKLPFELTPEVTVNTADIDVIIKNNGHWLTVSKNISNGIKFANNLNYDFFYYLESDNIFSDEDFIKLNSLYLQMFEENKKIIFFKYGEEGFKSYDTLMFGGIPSFYINNINLPTTVEECKHAISFERLLYYETNYLENDFLIVNEQSKNFFKTSEINKISHDCFVDVIGSGDKLVLFIFNCSNKSVPIIFTINKHQVIPLNSNCWYFSYVNIGDEIEVEINDDRYITYKNFTLTENNKSYYQNKGVLKLRNNG
jgi:hypothetical protein